MGYFKKKNEIVKESKSPKGDGNFYTNTHKPFDMVKESKSPKGDGNCYQTQVANRLRCVKESKSPKGDRNFRSS